MEVSVNVPQLRRLSPPLVVPWQDDGAAIRQYPVDLSMWRLTRELMVVVVAKGGRSEPLIVEVGKEDPEEG
jgi:hypothetical protein